MNNLPSCRYPRPIYVLSLACPNLQVVPLLALEEPPNFLARFNSKNKSPFRPPRDRANQPSRIQPRNPHDLTATKVPLSVTNNETRPNTVQNVRRVGHGTIGALFFRSLASYFRVYELVDSHVHANRYLPLSLRHDAPGSIWHSLWGIQGG